MSSPNPRAPNATIFPDSLAMGNVMRRRNRSNSPPALWSRGNRALFHLHPKFETIPAHAASKALINLLRRMHRKRRRLFRVKWTQPGKILPALFQANVFADHANDVRLLFYFVRK